MNVQGKVVYAWKSGQRETVQLPMENWDSGFYMVNISTNQRIWNLPLLVGH
jgi:hypothetical protein